MHPSDNKQNVNLAVAIFHETTIAACESYFPDRADMLNFLRLISCWWTIANSRKKLTPNFLNNAVILNEGKIEYFQCEMCSLITVGNDSDKATDKEYFDFVISRGSLIVPSRQMVEFVCTCFAILEYADQFTIKNHESTTSMSAEQVLGIYSPKYSVTCEKHIEKGLIFAIKIVVNIFYNNKQKISSDEVRKNTVECLKKRQRSKENPF